METATATTNVELAVGLARIEEKVDGITQRLDVQNGSIAKLTAKAQEHDIKLTTIETEENLLQKFVKPAFISLALIVSAVVGHKLDPKMLMDLFK
jgi:hypothetical protein